MLVLDSLEDPQNVGHPAAQRRGGRRPRRSLFPTRRQAPLTPAAVKASAGAVEHLLLCPVDDLPGALADLHAHGLRVAGSEADAPLTARQTDLRGPLAIVVGSEGQGLGPAVRRRCDLFMRIPMRGAIGSLNAAVAGFDPAVRGGRPARPGVGRRRRPRADAARRHLTDRDRTRRAAETTPAPTAAPASPKDLGATDAASRSPHRRRADAGPDGRQPTPSELLPGEPAATRRPSHGSRAPRAPRA
mgnify:CR=1 FL=1